MMKFSKKEWREKWNKKYWSIYPYPRTNNASGTEIMLTAMNNTLFPFVLLTYS